MKIISWNVNGIRAILNKGLTDFINTENPDIFCVQETKAHPSQVDSAKFKYAHHFWNSAEKKGYSGTAIFSKFKPISVMYDHEQLKGEGRTIVLEFNDNYLVTVYTPNSARGLSGLRRRQEWDKIFLAYLLTLEEKKPVIICGDLNVAHTELDLANPKENYNKTAGYTQVEIDGFQRYIDYGFIDSFREFNTAGENYTFWSYMFNARKKNIGWRIDYFLLSPKLRPRLKDAFILSKVNGSDHCPIGIELK